jgi:transposase
LLRNPEHLTADQATTLAMIAELNAPLYRTCVLKKQLRMVFHVGYHKAVDLLKRWLRWARRCRIEPFVAHPAPRRVIRPLEPNLCGRPY